MNQPPPNRAPASRPSVAPLSRRHGSVGWLGLLLFASVIAAYWPALHGTFIWDDGGHITRPDLQSLGGLARIWFEVGATQQYYPVLHSAFWLEHFALGDVPTGYHVINVLLHATAACLFAAALRRLHVPGAWVAAFLFALHPVCVESVAWISEQKNTLSTVWYLLAALAYLRFDGTRRIAHYAVASILFALAVATKTVTSTLPAALLIIFWWQRGRLESRRDVMPLLPWFGLSLAAGLTTTWVEHRIVGAEHTNFDLDWVQRILLASRAVFFYFGKLIYPAGLAFNYPRWTIDDSVVWQDLFPTGILLVVGAAWRWRRDRGALAAGLFFVATLFPALGFVNVYPFVFSFVADHFQYLASLGIFAGAGAGLALLLKRWPVAPTAAVTLALLPGFGVLTWQQSREYRDPITLYRATLAKNPTAWMAHNNLATALTRSGRAQEAIPHLEAAVRLRPTSAEPENNWGYALLNLGEPAQAIPHFERALKIQSDYVFAYNNLGLALMTLGRLDEAEKHFRSALQLKPDYPEAHLNLALTLGQSGRTPEALDHFSTAVHLRPGYVEAEFNWAIGLTLSDRAAESYPHFERALRLAPTRPDIHNAFGRALALNGRLEESLPHFRDAVNLAPDFAEAHFNFGEALQQLGRPEEAAAHFAEARRLGWPGSH